MASAKKSTSNRVKPVSSAAKVRMADTKATKAANAKAPRNPRGQQGYGMDTSKGSVRVMKGTQPADRGVGGRMGTAVYAEGKTKKAASSLLKSALKSKAAGVSGKKIIDVSGYTDWAEGYSRPSYEKTREYESKTQPSVKKKKITKK